MKYLLDTHTLFWATVSPADLSPVVQTLINDPGNNILVSAASAWEMSTKVRVGRWKEAVDFEQNFEEGIRMAGYTVIPVEQDHALLAGRMAGAHGDPFDRMLAAQSILLDAPVLSVDKLLDTFNVHRIW